MGSNGSTAPADTPSYGEWSRQRLRQLGEDPTAVPIGTWVWAFVQVGGAIVYALLDIARAIRERA